MLFRSPQVVLSYTDPLDANRGVIGIDNLIDINNLTATSEQTDYPVTNLANPATYLLWKSSVTTEQYLTIELDGSQLVDYVGLARHNLGTGRTPVSVEAAATLDSDGFPDWEEVVPDFIPDDDSALLLQFAPDYYTAVRVRFQSTALAPTAAVLNCGKLIVLERSIYVGHTPIVFGREDRIINARSESGEFLGRIILSEGLTTSIALRNLSPVWYRSTLDPFVVASKELPFFYSWRPGKYPRETAFGWVSNNPRPVNDLPNGMMSIQIDIGAIQ